jgi:ankyrin repeat protein
MDSKVEESQNTSTIPPFSQNLELDKNLVLSNDTFEQNIKDKLKIIEKSNSNDAFEFNIKQGNIKHTKHKFKRQKIEKSNSEKLNSVAEYPTPYIFATFSSKAYENYEETRKENYEKDLPTGWQLLTVAFNETNHYFGATYWNAEKHQIIIAHRGTDPKKKEVIYTDFFGIVMNEFVPQMNSASTFAVKVSSAIRAINKEFNQNLQLFFTGHSLGAWLAQVTTFTTKYLYLFENETFQKNQEEGYHAHTVVFDSPGCKEMLSKMADTFGVRYDENNSIDINSLDITSFQSAPNRINTFNRHVGKLYRIFINFSDDLDTNNNSNDSFIQKLSRMVTDALDWNNIKDWFLYTLKAHSMTKILEVFDPTTGQIRKEENGEMLVYDVVDWPFCSLRNFNEYNEFFKFIKCFKLKSYHVDEFKVNFCPIRYQIKPFNDNECSINVFTQSEQNFLKIYQTLAQEPDIFQISSLFDSINDERTNVQEILNGFKINDTVICCASAEKLKKFIPYVKLLLQQLYPDIKIDIEKYLNNSGLQIAKKFYEIQTEQYLAGKSSFDFENNDDLKDKITNFLNDNQKKVWQAIVQEDTHIGFNKIYQLLKKSDLIEQYYFIALDLERLLNANRFLSLKKLFESNELTNLLIMVEIKQNDNVGLKSVEGFFENLLIDLKNEFKSIKIMFLTQNNDFSEMLSNLCGELSYSLSTTKIQGVVWKDFTNEAKPEILKKKVLFQGNELSLNNLTKCLSDETLNRILETKTIVKLLNNNLIKIGPDLSFDYDESYYIPRSLNYYTKINNDLFKEEDIKSDIILISGDIEIAKRYLSNNLKFIFESNDEQAKNKFTELCKKSPKSKIHWLKYENHAESFIWQRSQGNLSILRKYFDNKNYTKQYKEEALIQDQDSSKIFIISDTAGMGKSTFITHLSKQIKQISSNDDSWLIRLNLNDYTDKLYELNMQKYDFQKDDVSIKFLSDILLINKSSPLEKELFQHNIKTGKSIIMFDGFDEISPDYKNIVINLLKALMIYNTKQLWITTRPNMRIELEDNLQQFAYILEPFTEKNQIDFLTKYWMNKLDISNCESRLEAYAKKLLINLKESINDRDFTGIPLQTRMLAEVYDFDELEDKLKIKPDLNDLYEKFLKKKFEINIKEKNKIDLTKPQNKNEFKVKTKIYEDEHQILAVCTLFNETTYTELLKEDEIKIKDTFIANFKEGENNIGVINKIIEDKPQFIHRTFAEYLVISFLMKRLKRKEISILIIEKILLESDYQVMRAFFNSNLKKKKFSSKDDYKNLWQEIYKSFEKKLKKNSDSIFHIAVKENNIEIVKFLVENLKIELRVNAENFDGDTVMHISAYSGNFEIVKFLVENYQEKLDINAKNVDGQTVLHKAAYKDKWDIVKFLIENYKEKLEIIAENKKKETIFHIAALNYNWNIFKFLIDNYKNLFNINAKTNDGETVLHIAAYTDKWDIVKFLVENYKEKLEINTKNSDDETVLHIAAYKDKWDIVKFLVENYKDKLKFNNENNNKETILHIATNKDNWDIVKFLYENYKKKLNINSKNGNETVLHIAAYTDKWDIVKFLVENYKDQLEINAENNREETIFHIAAYKDNWDILKFLIDSYKEKLDINAKNKKQRTIFHIAAYKGKWDIVRFLVENYKEKLNINSKNGNETIFHIAAYKDKWDIVRFLVENYKDQLEINAKNNIKETILHMAAYRDNIDIVKFLVENYKEKLEINTKNSDDETVLHIAAYKDKWDIVKFLVENYKDKLEFNNENYYKKTIFHIAAYKGKWDIVKFLYEKYKNRLIINFENNNETVLHIAAYEDKWDMVKFLVENYKEKLEINAKNIRKETIFHMAAYRDNIDIVKFLVENYKEKLEINAKTNDGDTVMHISAYSGNFEIVKFLVENYQEKLEINIKNSDDETVLHIAAYKDKWDILKSLVDNYKEKLDINAETNDSETVMHIAAYSGNFEIVKFLVENYKEKLDTNAKNKRKETFFHIAALSHNWDILKFLIDNYNEKLDINAETNDGDTVMHISAYSGNFEIVKFLVENYKEKLDTNAKNKRKETFFHIAALSHNWDILKFLIDNYNEKLDINAETNDGDTVMHISAYSGNFEIVKFLVENYKEKLEITAKNKSKESILHMAANRDNIDIINILVENYKEKLDINAKNNREETVMHKAVYWGLWEIIKFLIDNYKEKLDINAKNVDGQTVLHIAAYKDKWDIVKFLVENYKEKLEINAENIRKETIFHIAALSHNWDILKFLIDNYKNLFNINAKTNDGETVLHMAANRDNKDIVKFLVENYKDQLEM